jgi:hypothetical protein
LRFLPVGRQHEQVQSAHNLWDIVPFASKPSETTSAGWAQQTLRLLAQYSVLDDGKSKALLGVWIRVNQTKKSSH